MGLLNKLFKGKQQETAAAVQNNQVAWRIKMLTVHPDIRDLVWISDGPGRNYFHTERINEFNYEGVRFVISGLGGEEPSLISTKLPFTAVEGVTAVERPPYYPRYSQLTPEQRGVYWKLLENPYDASIDIGFVFILYYGLERHLLEGNYDRAFDVILKLRDAHQNSSFQHYSACALILASLFRQRRDLAKKFFDSLDKQYELNFSDNLYLLCKLGLDIPLNCKDLMRMAKTFGFVNVNYIKKYPRMFEEFLSKQLDKIYGTDSIVIKDHVTSAEWRKLHKETVQVFANVSLSDKTIDVPILAECFKLKKTVYDLLEVAHEATKAQLAQMRKSGEFPIEIKPESDKKILDRLNFDMETERQLLSALEKSSSNAVDRHFSLIALQEFYYKYRDLDEKFIQLCIHYCNEDIELLPQVQAQYRKDEEDNIHKLSTVYSKKEIEQRLADIGCFNGNIHAFKRLAIIHEKNKDYQMAIADCDRAIDYYMGIGMITAANDFSGRKEKLIDRMIKQ